MGRYGGGGGGALWILKIFAAPDRLVKFHYNTLYFTFFLLNTGHDWRYTLKLIAEFKLDMEKSISLNQITEKWVWYSKVGVAALSPLFSEILYDLSILQLLIAVNS